MSFRIPTAIAASLGLGALTLGITGPAAAAPADASAAADTALVSVFHGVPDLPVDVYANGEELLPDFQPGTLTDPVELDPGSYEITVFEAGADPSGTPTLETTVEVGAGDNATLTANLSEDGTPALNAYVNDTSEMAAGTSRLTARHIAAAPAVDVRADGNVVFSGLENPGEDTTEVDAGTVSADVTLAGTDTVAIGPADLDLAEGTVTIVYAWGSAEDDNLALAVQTIDGTHTAPGHVDAGTSGAAANSSEAWMAWSAAGLAGLGAALLVSRRARQDA
ncbi:DUF4397 domain-containing protein [Streptomyces otsuchiensis]|uniref:DUF4397 domain-containing protein n=1 Tax=Streptomyces otsuchiensis TaxID=2681388 RepID=UPI001030C9EF|nr:DUF4397 domain-containing protein [Streptomyces otsuchiensis]